MTISDTINRIFREFYRYTGDGLPGEPVSAPLPVGDPQSGVYSPKKSELRAALIDVLIVPAENAAAAEAALADIQRLYLGAKAADPTTDNNGDPLETGAMYFNTVDGKFRVWTDADIWQNQSIALSDSDVTTGKIADLAVTTGKIADLAVTTGKIADGSVTVAKLIDVILDEDDFSSDSATKAPSQQSVKAYVDGHGLIQSVGFQTGALSSGSTVIPNDDTIPQNTEGTEFMTIAITPKSATSILEVDVLLNGSGSTAGYMSAALFQDSIASALAAGVAYVKGSSEPNQVNIRHRMVAGTTSAITFKVRAGMDTSNIIFNGVSGSRYFGGVMASSITVKEIKA